MNRISWGEALRVVIGPALLVGPLIGMLGLLSANSVIALNAYLAGNTVSGGLIGLVLISLTIGAPFGLIIGSPICLLFAASMYKAGAAERAWRRYWAWCAAGSSVGLIAAAIWLPIYSSTPEFALKLGCFTVPFGIVAAAICRHLLKSKIGELSADDFCDVF